MLIWIRNIVYLLLVLLAAPWLLYRSSKTGRYRQSWKPKLFGTNASPETRVAGTSNTSPSTKTSPIKAPTIWLHGVSVGEVQLLKPLVDELKQLLPQANFAVSSTTETGMELAQKLFAEPSVQLLYFPFDFSWAIRRVMRTLNPSLIVLGELELWPNLIDIATQQQVPIAVVNGRLSERSFAGYSKFLWLIRPMFKKLAFVAAQDAGYASRFEACGTPANRVAITGSFKFDNVAFDRNALQIVTLRSLIGVSDRHRVLVVGSTQAPEEKATCQAFIRAKAEHPDLKLVIVPRHKERFDSVAQYLSMTFPSTTGIRVLRRSTLAQPTDAAQWDVLLVDTIGELRWWWGLAEIAIVGGSFGQRGGQNMLEPAAYGVNVAFGPNTQNFRDIADMLLRANGAERIASAEAIEAWLLRQLADPTPGQLRGKNAQHLIAQQQGALQRTAQLLAAQLTP